VISAVITASQLLMKETKYAMVIVHAELTITFLIITSFICSSFMLNSLVRQPNTILRMISTLTLQDTAKHLVHSNVKTYVCIAVAGGGGHAISTLASTPGASALFLEGTVTYDRKSLQNYVGQTIPEDQKYVSYETASLLSRASLRRAMQYRGHLQDYPHCVGVGITSTLVSTVEHSKNSFGFVVATRADGFQWKCSISLSSKKSTRYEEDILFSDIVLQSLHLVMSNGEKELQLLNPADVLDQKFLPLTPKDEIQAAAERILQGDAQAVLLLPNSNRTFQSMLDPVVPPKSLVFPGSFNPPHIGHTSLAKAASRGEAVIWEISLTNPDKPDIDPLSVSQRAHQFFELEKELPSQWAILLTRAPLFQQKVKALQMFLPRG
jgi:Competence-damaged protein/Cytidylyltransferase-like